LGEFFTRLDGSGQLAIATLTFSETGKFAFKSDIEDPPFRCPAVIPYSLENSTGNIKFDKTVCPDMTAGAEGRASSFNFTFVGSSDSINFNGVMNLGPGTHAESGTLRKGGDCSENVKQVRKGQFLAGRSP